MKRITEKELADILDKHKKWLKGEIGGKRAVLYNRDLSGSNLFHCDLSESIFSNCNLSHCGLSGSNLFGSNISNCNFSGSYISHCNFSRSIFSSCNLSQCDFFGNIFFRSNLSSCNLSQCDFSESIFFNCNLSHCNLSRSDLSHCYLSRSDLSHSNLSESNLYVPLSCPSDGEFIAWKNVNDYIVKLLIPADAKRISATSNKCRSDKAFVLAIENMDGTAADVTEVVNDRYARCVYTVGKAVYPDSFDEDRWTECSHGIHFFINRQDAVNW